MNHHPFPWSAHDALLFPLREQAAHGEHGGTGQLPQLLLGKRDFDAAIHGPTYLAQQSNDFKNHSCGDLLRRDLPKTLLELP
jgi:hypothetical protein